MKDLRRLYLEGGTYFFTVVTSKRRRDGVGQEICPTYWTVLMYVENTSFSATDFFGSVAIGAAAGALAAATAGATTAMSGAVAVTSTLTATAMTDIITVYPEDPNEGNQSIPDKSDQPLICE